MKKFLFTTLAVGALAVSAGAAVSANYSPENNGSKCYWISTPDDLDDFAKEVVNKGNLTACAKLQNDIYYQGENVSVLNSAGTGVNTAPAGGYRKWNPIGMDASGKHFPYKGTFDGNDKTIYGLFCEQNWEPSFMAKVQGGAIIKRLVIADSYFHVTNSSGNKGNAGDGAGFIGDIPQVDGNKLDVTLDKCGFKGLVYAENRADKDGGLVGSIGAGASVVITNSYNEGTITGSTGTSAAAYLGGLVGYVNSNSHLEMTNCYNAGSAKTDPIIGGKDGKAGNISGVDVGCVGSSDGCDNNLPLTKSEGYLWNKKEVPTGNSIFADSDPAKVVENYNTLCGNADYQADNVLSNYDAEMLTEVLGETISGVTFEDVETGCDINTEGCKPTTAVAVIKTELKEDETVSIPQTIKIGGVKFDRKFVKNAMSSIVMPFSIKAANVTNAKFFDFAGINKETSEDKPYWSVEMDSVCPTNGCSDQILLANHPYYVMRTDDKDDSTLTFNGEITLTATEGASLEYRGDEDFDGEWAFQGVYSYKKWAEGDPELGSVYGQAAKDASAGTYKAGDFVKISKNSYIKAMRAYLAYRPAVVAAKKRALAKTIASVEEMPKIMTYRIRPYKGQESIENPEVEVGSEEDGTLGMTKAIKVPSSLNIMDRWYDSKGRRMNKPNSQGAFIKNGTPVIVK